MNSREQNIKNGAIAFAIILAVVIIGIMCVGIYSVVSIFVPVSDDVVTDKTVLKQYLDQTPEVIIIDNSVGQLTIESGDFLQVSGNNVLKDFSCKFDDGTLTIDNTYNKKMNISGTTKCTLTVTVPKNTELKRLAISTGAGNATINNLITDAITVNAGAGNIEVISSELNDMTLNCGVGNFDIKDSKISGDSKIECGVGNFTLNNCELSGECEADCGVGEFKLDLNGNLDDYEIDISSSLGKIKLNGKTYSEVENLNKGASNKLKIDGGVGEITIDIN